MRRIQYQYKAGYSNCEWLKPLKGNKFKSWTIDGADYNGGECKELVAKDFYHLPRVKDNTAWNTGADIAEMEISVKSAKASLCESLAGLPMDVQIARYCSECACKAVMWVEFDGDLLEMWIMPLDVFAKFTKRFAHVSTDGKIHFPTTSALMRQWFKAN